MTGTIPFSGTDPVTYPFPGSCPNPIPDSYPIPNYPMGRIRQEKDLRARCVRKGPQTESTDFKHESYPSTLPGRRPLQ
ncbi:MAG TPA: hypothetical protein PK575_13925 [Syntrophorhabdus sp.]|nr:hypothetical protein [Syntrophorhabdus sp.]